jgi:folate-binding protein YgfZ
MTIPGAVAAEGVDEGVAAHYGDPLREQRLLTEEVAVVDRGNRGVLAVPGPDRLTWLHSLLTQHVERLPAWRGTEALLLSPHGHIENHVLIADDGETTWLDTEPGRAGELLAFLEKMRFMLRVDPADVTDRWSVLSVLGPRSGEVLPTLAEWQVAALPSGGWVRRNPWGADLLVPRDQAQQVAQGLGVPFAGVAAYEAVRVAARRPRLRFETDHRTIVQEPEWVASAVHLEKGCYRGQETVARVHNLGRPPRRMVLLHLDGVSDDLPAHGDPVESGGRAVGFVGTAVRHYELGPIALALVKRNVLDDAVLQIGETRAAID